MTVLVRDLMTPQPITLPSEAPLREALELMQMNGIHEIPVVNGDQLAGIITERDLRGVLGGRVLNGELDEVGPTQLDEPISSAMTEAVQTLDSQETAATACHTLAELRVGAMPVVNGARLVGILSVTDLLGAAAELFEREF